MNTTTSSAPAPAAGARRRSTRRENEARLLACAAAGWTFELRTLPADVPSCDDTALLRAASGLALLASAPPGK